MNKRSLYESIMKNVAREVKRALNEGELVQRGLKPEHLPMVSDFEDLEVSGTMEANGDTIYLSNQNKTVEIFW